MESESAEPTQPNDDRKPSIPVAVWLSLIVAAGVGGFLFGSIGTRNEAEVSDKLAGHHSQIALSDSEVASHKEVGLQYPAVSLGENTIAEVAARASKYVVCIEVAAKGYTSHGEEKNNKYFFGPNMRPAPDFPRPHGRFGMGAGIIVRSDGHVITSNHVTRGADEIKVTLADGREAMAQVVARDNVTDIALLKVPLTGLTEAVFADSGKVRPGDWTIAIGSPMRLSNSVSFGIISAIQRNIGSPFNSTDLIQTDAAINPGSSGGPLVNLKGQVIGMNCIVRSDAQNIGFAVPAATVKTVVEQLLKNGKVERSYIGVRMDDAVPVSLKESSRVVISYVLPDGPAGKAGVKAGDQIKRIDGKEIKTFFDVKRIVQEAPQGAILPVVLVADDKERSVSIKLESMPENLPR